ncbi:MAG TPA: hypothetical protein VMP67_02115, partial [Candidatus Limnocylindria bacterium]|nr:hypothetical protein [Candidatus Limnocylindria bacterium]
MRITIAAMLAFVLLGCAGAPPSASPSPSPSSGPTPTPTPQPESGLYLRAWLTQALPPETNVGWLPMLTVSDGVVIDGNVAVPAIFPGPLLILPNARGLSEVGEAALVEQARELG